MGRSFAMALMAAAKSSLATAAEASFVAMVDRLGQRFLFGQFVALGVGRAGVFVLVLLLLDAQDVGGALDAGEQVLAVVGVEEFAERLDAAHDHQQVVLAAEREHGVDQIVPRALLAQLDLQAVGEESEQVRTGARISSRAFAKAASSGKRSLLSTIMRMTPSAARRSA